MTLYRVFNYDPDAAPHERGGALYMPPVGRGRINNPDLYRVLYLSSHPEAAIAERFGRIPTWDADTFLDVTGRPLAIAAISLPDSAPIADLDDAHRLVSLSLRPSDVVTRDYAVSQSWAARIFHQGGWIGVSWWSYCDPRWHSYGLWTIEDASHDPSPVTLSPTSPEVVKAASAIDKTLLQ